MTQRNDSGAAPDAAALLTIEDVARHLRVESQTTVRTLIRRGDCPPCDLRLRGRPRWIARRFVSWLEKRAIEHEAAVEAALDRGDPGGADAALSRLKRAADLRGDTPDSEDRRAS